MVVIFSLSSNNGKKKVRADESEMVWKAQNKKFEKLDAGDLLL